jgi:hypothetical protein
MKKSILFKSTLKLTKSAGRAEGWTMDQISKRQRSLAKEAVKTWPRKPVK